MSRQELPDNRIVVEPPGRLLEKGGLSHLSCRDGGPVCFMTTTTMRWLPAALGKGGLV